MNAASICQSVAAAMPVGAIVVDEGNMETFNFPELTMGAAAHDFVQAPTGGAIGQGVSMAIGVSVAGPDRQVICLEGDFSLNFCIMALWTMAKQQTDLCVINMNNTGSRALQMELARVRPGDETDQALSMLLIQNPEPDYVKIAEGYGVPGTKATTAEEFHEQFVAAMENKGPHFIDAHVESMAPATIKMICDNLVL